MLESCSTATDIEVPQELVELVHFISLYDSGKSQNK